MTFPHFTSFSSLQIFIVAINIVTSIWLTVEKRNRKSILKAKDFTDINI